jgi:hypothetical protein
VRATRLILRSCSPLCCHCYLCIAKGIAYLRTRKHGLLAYPVTLLIVAIATLARWLIDEHVVSGVQFLTYYPAIILATFLCGLWPGILANRIVGGDCMVRIHPVECCTRKDPGDISASVRCDVANFLRRSAFVRSAAAAPTLCSPRSPTFPNANVRKNRADDLSSTHELWPLVARLPDSSLSSAQRAIQRTGLIFLRACH